MRKPRGPQKGLPNSARDLLPMLQPATKALAQMLAGRTQVSGQLEQARAVLGQAERLIADRVHNRLNPAEREEFFEQLARLRLTLADAADEAEARAVEEQQPRPPAAPPIAQERLKEMALALATPEGTRRRIPSGADEGSAEERSTTQEDDERAPRPEAATAASAPREGPDGAAGAAAESAEASPAAPEVADGPRRLLAINRAGRLELPRDVAASAAQTLSGPPSRTAARRRSLSAPLPTAASAAPAAAARDADEHAGNGAGTDAEEGAGTDAEEKAKPVARRSRKTKAGLPEGWIIDEEGFVVPGPS